ncbi:MAG: alanine--tRNA ligase [Candidatus Omnitrophica bacterium]|nr:alanine--tRNA ligase [Candidatus Omnitrophota bacterium]
MKHTRIRGEYLDFFKGKGHRIVPSDSLVPAGDPSLLFTSAGMTQFKNEFMGNVKDFTRAASCQKCMRTADLDNVGRTCYHHSFFEMLGNFSFGDYFKKEAIAWAWEFLTVNLRLDPASLWASVYEEDEESYFIWQDMIKIPGERIVKLGQKDNFWPSEAKDKGPNGPCGPCSEIYYDYGPRSGCGRPDCTPACSCGRFVEIWNLVFTQYNRKDSGLLEPLPNKNIDTGMGLERLCAVMQGVKNNFETDLFVPIIEAIKKELDIAPAGGSVSRIHAVADHARAAVFAIADGITPSNEDRGYVIRNILRRALLHAIELGAKEPVLYKLIYSVSKVMQEPYPELSKKHQDIAGIVRLEEEKFFSTLKKGRSVLDAMIKEAQESGRAMLSGEDAFRLFDTHGLPFAVTKQLCHGRGFSVDEDAFNGLMRVQREQSRQHSNISSSVFLDTGIKEKTEFIGYDKCRSKAKVLRIMSPDGDEIHSADSSLSKAQVILDQSVFYPQQGGQEPDKGRLFSKAFEAEVFFARKVQGYIVLDIKVLSGRVSRADIVESEVNVERRMDIARNHTATHLLQAALRCVLGSHVQQQGSMVDADRLRFDFTHFKAMTPGELQKAEAMVNEYINGANAVAVEEMTIEQARATGALAFFGDKYGQKVRVVKAGNASLEFCAGTHLGNTSDIALFRIVKEGSAASGIRRIEAVTAQYAMRWQEDQARGLAVQQKAFQDKQEKKKLEKDMLKKSEGEVDLIIESAEEMKGIRVIIKCLNGRNMDALKRISDIIRNRLEKGYIIFLAAPDDLKIPVYLCISKDLAAKGFDASNILNTILVSFSGSGGGRQEAAQGGVKGLKDAGMLLSRAKEVLAKQLGETV